MTPIPIREQIFEVKAEIKQRYQVYPNMVYRGKISQATMDRKILVMEAVLGTLEAQETQPELFSQESSQNPQP